MESARRRTPWGDSGSYISFRELLAVVENTTYQIRIVNKFEEFDDKGGQKLVIGGRVVGESEANGSDDGSACVMRCRVKTSLKLR